jgi:hypothetical protein
MPSPIKLYRGYNKKMTSWFSVENATFILLIVIFFMVLYLYYEKNIRTNNTNTPYINNIYSSNIPFQKSDPFNDPYSPPLKNDSVYFPPDSGDIRGVPSNNRYIINDAVKSENISKLTGIDSGGLVAGSNRATIPINMVSRSYSPDYTQIGLLTKTEESQNNPLILPLMGRRILNGRDKFQYYSLSNTGMVNTKLPIKFKGRSCTSDIGCDELSTNDVVYVEGYKETFKATIYENAIFSYIPI